MSPKTLISIGGTVGSIVGGYIPTLWGDSGFSTIAVILTFVGGILGIFIAYKIIKSS